MLQILATLLVKVLLAQNEMLAPALLGASGVLVNIGTNLMFIRWYGFLGAPIATTISRVLLLLGAIAVLAHSQHCKTSQTPPGKILYTLASDSGDRIVLTSADSEQDINVSTLESQDVAPSEAVRLAHERTDTLVPPDDAGAPASQSVEQISALKAACMASVSWEKVWRQAVEWKSIWEYLKLAIPGGFMVAMESSSFDITTVMAGTLGVAEVCWFTPLHDYVLHACIACTQHKGQFIASTGANAGGGSRGIKDSNMMHGIGTEYAFINIMHHQIVVGVK